MFAEPHRQHHFSLPLQSPQSCDFNTGRTNININTALKRSHLQINSLSPATGEHRFTLPELTQQSEDTKPSEIRENVMGDHMLRRKTPNGTLSAGYDGKSMDWGPNKRFMGSTGNMSWHPPLHDINNSTRQISLSGTNFRHQQSQIPLPMGPDMNGPPAMWPYGNRNGQSLDSMLYQGVQNINSYHNPMYQIPHVIQPGFWPPNHPLTVSNAQIRFGPYWPDGSFEPYRPAASRDSRFQAQWGPEAPYDHNGQGQSRTLYSPRTDFHGWGNQGPLSPRHSSMDPRVNFQRHDSDPNPMAQSIDPYRVQNYHPQSNQSTASIPQWSPATNSGQIPNPTESSQPQFRSRVLYWAHRAHANLLEMRRQSMPKSSRHHSQRLFKRLPGPTQDLNPQSQNELQSRAPIQIRHHQSHQQRSFSDRVHSSSGNLDTQNAKHQLLPSQLEHNQNPDTTVQSSHVQAGTPLHNAIQEAQHALQILDGLCSSNNWTWIDGMLLGGCLAYGLEQFSHALHWYEKVLILEPENVEALSNTAAAFSALKRRKEAETYWHRAIQLRPNHWEAVEHLVGLLCQDQRPRDAVVLIQNVEHALRRAQPSKPPIYSNEQIPLERGVDLRRSSSGVIQESGYRIPAGENGRLIALIHAKGNMLYALGDNAGASRAFEEAILLGCGKRFEGISGLIKHILEVFTRHVISHRKDGNTQLAPFESILLTPSVALETKRLVFPLNGQLPGLAEVPTHLQSTAILYASNSLLSLAKIYQDGMSSGGAGAQVAGITPGVQDILALYYLSLSLQPSPSTANNVGILLASVQQTVPQKYLPQPAPQGNKNVPGVVQGSGIALALSYYNYGLSLDDKHAHLYTNLGSLLKDIGQLNAAIRMYESAVNCDGNFDIALANLANAVKDQGRISDAITYYKRAVKSSPEFPEAVCGLANALNSVCNWKGRGGVIFDIKKHDRWHVDDTGMLVDSRDKGVITSGWIGRVVSIVEKQLQDGKSWGKDTTKRGDFAQLMSRANLAGNVLCDESAQQQIVEAVSSWSGQKWEGAKVVRLVERAIRRLGWQMYQERYVLKASSPVTYQRPQLPAALTVPSAPTVLPFHTFTCPLTASQIRKISQRNGLRISCSTQKAPWLPSTIFEPPAPPQPYLKVGYVSSDFNNHPLAHLMQSVFGFHDPSRVKAICYATTPSDGSIHRQQIERESPVFYDASSWSVDKLVKQIVADGIHIVVNLNGYTRGARNEVFAARPAPIQMSFMGFAGTLGAEWCDYLLADDIAVPPSTLRPWRDNVNLLDQIKDNNYSEEESDWVYGENIVFAKETFFCCDHRQSAPDAQEKQLSWTEEKQRRKQMRKELFPDLAEDTIILGNFNQLYKIEPTTFRTWLRILQALPKAVLWLLRFPDLGEQNLREIAVLWSSPSVAQRVIFTDVAPKNQHIARARVCDLFLDTPECNAHTTAADVLWSGTPLLTLPRYEYKMCSRMAASILRGALPRGIVGDVAAQDLTASSDEDYEAKAIELGNGLTSVLNGENDTCRLLELRKLIYEGRWTSALFDTRRWVRHLEDAYEEAWRKWVAGEGGDIWLKDIITDREVS